MGETFRVSVRELVAFRYFPPDIAPMGSVEDMLAGTAAHQARENALAAEFEIEKPIRAQVMRGEHQVTVFGRMDAFCAGDIPTVHELKLCFTPPEAPLPEHLAQARLYGALLALGEPKEIIRVQVAYVNAQGIPQRVFTEEAPRDALLLALEDMLAAWFAVALPERLRERTRDESIKNAPFPFAGYRAGQRELAVQTYTAITRKRRLFASLPTGTGKSAAVLYPALKALPAGKTRKIIYLTARTTARQSPLNALEMMRAQGMRIRVSTLLAKEKMCPTPVRCHPDDCPRAKGHFLRQPDALHELFAMDVAWTEERIAEAADRHMLCPFELALTLCDYADVTLMDMNYAFDPFAQVARLFKRRKDFTLLIDEAHHLLDRVRESLSGSLDTRALREYRAAVGKAIGRKHAYYKQLTLLYQALRALQAQDDSPARQEPDAQTACENSGEPHADGAANHAEHQREATLTVSENEIAWREAALWAAQAGQPEPDADGRISQRDTLLHAPPPALAQAAQTAWEATFTLLEGRAVSGELRALSWQFIRRISPFIFAAKHYDARYAALLSIRGAERVLELMCLSPAEWIASVTKGLRGTVFFSATLAPLEAMRQLLGGTQEDACFALASPFPPENLAVVRRRVQTRYAFRQESAARVAQSIQEAVAARAGKYIAYFPSYAYLALVLRHLDESSLPALLVQESEMTEEARTRFLEAFTQDDSPKLGLCVLGGLFSEGVDLPGEQLIGVMIVGVGLPTPSFRLRVLKAYYGARFGDGFLYAWMIPAMHKVAQAGGRVIRTERDKGLILLLDDRYYDARYARLLPEHWQLTDEHMGAAVRALYGGEDT